MLKFHEKDRPSFIELIKIMLTIPDYAKYNDETKPVFNAPDPSVPGL